MPSLTIRSRSSDEQRRICCATSRTLLAMAQSVARRSSSWRLGTTDSTRQSRPASRSRDKTGDPHGARPRGSINQTVRIYGWVVDGFPLFTRVHNLNFDHDRVAMVAPPEKNATA